MELFDNISEISNIKIFNSMGETVINLSKNIDYSQNKIDISSLPPGLYTIQFGQYTEKFIKK